MPTKSKIYERVKFTPEVIRQAEEVLVASLGINDKKLTGYSFAVGLSAKEEWEYDNEDEFFADYIKGNEYAHYSKTYSWDKGEIDLTAWSDETEVSISMPNRANVEKVFNVLEASVERCRLPKQPSKKDENKTEWVSEILSKVAHFHPMTGRKLGLALQKLESDDIEEWQNACMQVRDAWIELAQHLCNIYKIDTTDIGRDDVIPRLEKLGIKKNDMKLFDLARSSFNLYTKHHNRNVARSIAVACVVSSIVSMQTIIQEVLNAHS